ncbi:hypothetical protein G7Y89_g2311 [Cudoniella acicularis]|uniref:laccase n=1 Tax=Cudoniella acicularis TaxID=354080 RepID=A0A8H4RUP4_9HELO|nr:hypothetical protein G7Y89_g2311 [Cudoniella acicularis]
MVKHAFAVWLPSDISGIKNRKLEMVGQYGLQIVYGMAVQPRAYETAKRMKIYFSGWAILLCFVRARRHVNPMTDFALASAFSDLDILLAGTEALDTGYHTTVDRNHVRCEEPLLTISRRHSDHPVLWYWTCTLTFPTLFSFIRTPFKMLVAKILLASLGLELAGASVLLDANLAGINKRQVETATGCDNSADRTKWCYGLDVHTDGEVTAPIPTASATKTFNIEVSEQTLSPIGVNKPMLVINGTYPGPTIIADWGDTLVINVSNKMINNGTSMHWHGINQNGTNTEDGVNGVTECPIPPNSVRTYTFVATQFGTTWYHSHYSGQYGDGVVGTMIINGPAAQQYDEDLGTFPITDYYAESIYNVSTAALLSAGGPPVANAALFNGTMKVGSTGAYANVTVVANKTYRLRLINTSVDNGFKVSLDGHPFTVIQADFVPIKPYTANWIFVGIGQRYDVLITTSNTPTNYWFRAEIPGPMCGGNTLSPTGTGGKILAVLRYLSGTTTSSADPASTSSVVQDMICADEKNLSPLVAKPIDKTLFNFVQDKSDQLNVTNTKIPGASAGTTVNSWTINTEAIQVNWGKPTLEYAFEKNLTGLTQDSDLSVYTLDKPGAFYFWVIQNSGPVVHPIHLHGHDFYILGATNSTSTQFGPTQTFTGTPAQINSLNFENPMRRDVASLPGNGWLVIAFEANNPGAWLLHCHIAWHISQGLGVQFLENIDLMKEDLSKVDESCKAWDDWYATTSFKQLDSGLRV